MAEAPEPTLEPVPGEPVDFLDRTSGPFFRKIDLAAFWTAFLATFAFYVATLAPTVTLEDSGELAVASDYLGVPHPPGYPIWTLLTWFFQWIFHWVTYFGQPNPAWSVGLLSAVSGALACGMLALLVCRSGADMLRRMKHETEVLGRATEDLLCWFGGVTGGLLFAVSSVLWSQSVIVEVYSLNAFFFLLIILLMYRWMGRPQDDRVLYITAFIFGLGLTNHQNLVFVGLGLAAAVWFCDRPLFRDCMAGLLFLTAIYLFSQAHKLGELQPTADILRQRNLQVTFGILFLVSPIGLFLIERKLFTEWKRVALLAFVALLGVSFYFYMPFSSEQNPPMNWGYPRTREGFMHALTRGQYEKISPITNLKAAFSDLGYFFRLMNEIITMPTGKPFYYISVVSQFTWPISLLALVPFAFMHKISRRARGWMWTTLIAFISLTVVFIIFQWPKLDVQTLFIGRVQYIQAHAIFALWISYGLIFAMTYLDTLSGGRKQVVYAGLMASLLLPGALLARNAYDEEFIKYVGGCEQNGHDFGWQFGNYQLRGAQAILEELKPTESPPPNPEYPPPMETNAVFFGGTDPGRFVPTYMIYSADVRSDVYLITQNALADNTYMNVMRDLYGDRIWIPSQQDSNYAFQKYVEDVQAGRIDAGAALSFQGGRVSVQGVQGVMTINGILARMIFEANKYKNAFYVEESYVIPWMYPYLEPHGLIMKINRDPLPSLPEATVTNDMAFWSWYSQRLLANKKFHRDVVARKTFSKLRSAIAGVYAYRRMFPEAEQAFREALDLYPLSPEANFRLADLLMNQRRFTDARVLIEEFLQQDPGNDKVESFLNQVRDTEQADLRRLELEGTMGKGGDLNSALELVSIYGKLNLRDRFEGLVQNILGNDLPPNVFLRVDQICAQAGRNDLRESALLRYLEKEPANPKVWVDFAAIQIANGKADEALQSLRHAIEIGGEPVRDVARRDNRFDPVRETDAFKQLVPTIQAGMPLNLQRF